jgi:hypothetical protein
VKLEMATGLSIFCIVLATRQGDRLARTRESLLHLLDLNGH